MSFCGSRARQSKSSVSQEEQCPMPEAVIVATARTPIGRAVKGSLKDMRPDDLTAFILDDVLKKTPQLDRSLVEDVIVGAASRRARRATTWPARRDPGRHARRPGRDRQPLLLVVAADHPHGRPRDPGRRGRRVHRRGRRDREPLPARRRRHRPPQPALRRGRGPHGEAHRGGERAVVAARGPARRLHRHGPDRRERRRVRRRVP